MDFDERRGIYLQRTVTSPTAAAINPWYRKIKDMVFLYQSLFGYINVDILILPIITSEVMSPAMKHTQCNYSKSVSSSTLVFWQFGLPHSTIVSCKLFR